MSAATQDLVAAIVRASLAAVNFDAKETAYISYSSIDLLFSETDEGKRLLFVRDNAAQEASKLFDLVISPEEPVGKPTKKKAAKKKKVEKVESGIWRLYYDHDWGLRGSRRVSEFYFRSKPSPGKLAALFAKEGLDIDRKEVWSLTRLTCSKAYKSNQGGC